MRIQFGLALSALLLSSCSEQAVQNMQEADAPIMNEAALQLEKPRTVYAMAPDAKVKKAQAEFRQCAADIAPIKGAIDRAHTKAFNQMIGNAERNCEHNLRALVTLKSTEKPDFRITDCWFAVAAANDYLDAAKGGRSDALDGAESGFSAMSESCVSPDPVLLSQAKRS
jgi:hypothetical protein